MDSPLPPLHKTWGIHVGGDTLCLGQGEEMSLLFVVSCLALVAWVKGLVNSNIPIHLKFNFWIQKQTEQTQVELIIIIFYTRAYNKVQWIAYMHDFCPVFTHL